MEAAKGSTDSLAQSVKEIKVVRSQSHLAIEMLLVNWYEGKVLARSDINLVSLAIAIEEKSFKVIKHTLESINIEVVGGVVVELVHCCAKHWRKVGTMKDIENILKAYPSTHFEYGSCHYHTRYIVERVRVDGWNRGWRIWMPEMRPHGDNPSTFFLGTSMWTKDTDDTESKQGDFFHRYVDSNLKPHAGQDRIYNADMYVRKL